MYIEDLIKNLVSKIMFTGHGFSYTNDYNILNSMNKSLITYNALTEKQSVLAIKILDRNKNTLRTILPDIDKALENPKWCNPFRILVSEKTIDIVKTLENGETKYSLSVQFPFDNNITEALRKRNQTVHAIHRGIWVNEDMAWKFSMTEKNIVYLGNYLLPNGFTAPDAFMKFYSDLTNVTLEVDKHIPMLVLDSAAFKIVNGHESIPDIDTTNVVEALYFARRYGINVWSDDVDALLDAEPRNVVNNSIFKSESIIWHDDNSVKLDDFSDLIKYGGVVMIVIPGGGEIKKLTKWHNFLNSLGIENDNISVLFRLPSVHADFNIYVRDNKLNSPLHENTKIIFVSTKVPKPFVKSNLRINTVINLGFYNYSHFTINSVIDSAQTLVYYSAQPPTGPSGHIKWQQQEL